MPFELIGKMYLCGVNYLSQENIDFFIQNALKEDIGPGDYSTLSSIPVDAISVAELKIKDDGIIAGVELSKCIFKAVDSGLKLEYKINDGELVSNGQIGLQVSGKVQSILSCLLYTSPSPRDA